MEEANKLIGAGKKHLVMGNAVEAARVLQEACGMLAKTFGDTADECGEALFWCGRALLDLARMENTVLGNALEGVPEEETEEGDKSKDSNVESTENVDEKTRDDLRAEVYDAMSEEQVNAKKQQQEEGKEGKVEEKVEDEKKSSPKKQKDDVNETSPSNEEDKENIEKTKEKQTPEKDEGDSGEEEEEEAGDEDDDDDAKVDGEDAKESDEEEEEEEVGNLQLAWEMLEVAKVIYKRKDTKEDQLLAAQVHLKLGEVSSESGNYSQALEDLQDCLALQEKHLGPDSRLLAETHYQLGLTHTLHCQYAQAVQHLHKATAIITARLDNLQKTLQGAGDSEEVSEDRKEMEELRGLLPDLKEKVEDAQESLKMTPAEPVPEDGGSTSSAFPAPGVQNGEASSSAKITAKPTNGVSSTNGHASNAPVSDISHLVRKKRKPEESPVKEGGTKKPKVANGEKVESNKMDLQG